MIISDAGLSSGLFVFTWLYSLIVGLTFAVTAGL